MNKGLNKWLRDNAARLKTMRVQEIMAEAGRATRSRVRYMAVVKRMRGLGLEWGRR